MTLIVKELIIRGTVTKDATSDNTKESYYKEELSQYLEQIQKSIKKECIAAVLSKLESKSKR